MYIINEIFYVFFTSKYFSVRMNYRILSPVITLSLGLLFLRSDTSQVNFHDEPCLVLQILMTMVAKCKNITSLPWRNTQE
jgi:hypothetical protein